MIFPYKEVNPSISRPIIPIVVKSDNVFILYDGLIDSGADYSIFSLEIAHRLGIKLSNKNATHFMGVGKDEVSGYWGNIDIRVAGIIYKTRVIFARISDFGHGILGQKGFFDQFDVNFSLHKQTIEITPVKATH